MIVGRIGPHARLVVVDAVELALLHAHRIAIDAHINRWRRAIAHVHELHLHAHVLAGEARVRVVGGQDELVYGRIVHRLGQLVVLVHTARAERIGQLVEHLPVHRHADGTTARQRHALGGDVRELGVIVHVEGGSACRRQVAQVVGHAHVHGELEAVELVGVGDALDGYAIADPVVARVEHEAVAKGGVEAPLEVHLGAVAAGELALDHDVVEVVAHAEQLVGRAVLVDQVGQRHGQKALVAHF